VSASPVLPPVLPSALWSDPAVIALLDAALAEDVGTGDVTTLCTVRSETRGVALIVAREAMIPAGLPVLEALAKRLAAMGEAGAGADELRVVEAVEDGQAVAAGTVLCRVEGPARPLLTIERCYLNLIGHLSGVATETARYVKAVRDAGASTRVLDTRKTTPGQRLLEKYAVACGGGANHRMGLFDAVLIKDNHVIAAGGIGPAVRSALARAPEGIDVEVEVDNSQQLREALEAGATAILLDNFTPQAVRDAVAEIAGRARVEVSGGISLATIADYARAGADDISVGRLTHSAPTADVSMEIELAL
jgi:nicotinate-nucleotide pyrophosphorylase (carboxylating)